MATTQDFNNTINQLTDMAKELGIHVTTAIFDEESRDDDDGDYEAHVVNIFFDDPAIQPLTLDAAE